MIEISQAMAQFVRWAMQEGPWDGCDLDGASIQDKAEELGLIVKTKYDPEKHGPAADWMFAPGDDWYTLAPEIAALIPPADRQTHSDSSTPRNP
jgi:hypothetical protein